MSEPTYETTTAPLINHALQAMLNDHGRQGWELMDVVDDTAELRRRTDEPVVWEYATVPLIPAAREVILDQWRGMGYELTVERDTVAYFKRPKES